MLERNLIKANEDIVFKFSIHSSMKKITYSHITILQ